MNYPTYGFPSYNAGPYQAAYPQQMQAFPQQRSAQPFQQASQGGSVCRPVTSRSEAEVTQIPFDGSTTWFYDTSADRVYAKTFNMLDGTAPLKTYVPENAEPAVQYATMDDLRALREEMMAKPKKAVKKDDADE